MKNIKYIAVLFLAVAIGCTTEKKEIVTERKCSLIVERNNDNGNDYTRISCDIFKMQNTRKVVFCVDSTEMIVISEKLIMPEVK